MKIVYFQESNEVQVVDLLEDIRKPYSTDDNRE